MEDKKELFFGILIILLCFSFPAFVMYSDYKLNDKVDQFCEDNGYEDFKRYTSNEFQCIQYIKTNDSNLYNIRQSKLLPESLLNK